MSYRIHRAPTPPPLLAERDDPAWAPAATARLEQFHDLESVPGVRGHRPVTTAQLLYDDEAMYLRFEVHDRWVRSVREGFQAAVSNDSCVEWFFSPEKSDRYFNLELNAGGHALCYDCRFRGEGQGFETQPLPVQAMRRLRIESSLPGRVEPEVTGPTTWRLGVALPWQVLRERVEGLAFGPGVTWRGNFYKCGDETSHPHWASWSPVQTRPLSFHHPPSFGELVFD
jgi:hypothetical protein